MSSGTHDDVRTVLALPADETAASYVREWLTGETELLQVAGADLRGADFSGSIFEEGWLTSCNMRGVRLAGAGLYRANLAGADLTDAVLLGADLVRANMNEACLVRADVSGARMGRSEMWGVDAREARFTGADFGDAVALSADMRGAFLRDVRVTRASLKIKIDDATVLEGLHGSMICTMTYVEGGQEHELADDELREFLRARGVDVEILRPAQPRPTPQPHHRSGEA